MAGTQEPGAQDKGDGIGRKIGNSVNKKYLFGTPEEIANRENVGYGDKSPAFNPSVWRQIPGQLSTGKSLSDPQFEQRNGDFKFSGGEVK